MSVNYWDLWILTEPKIIASKDQPCNEMTSLFKELDALVSDIMTVFAKAEARSKD